VSTFLVSFGVVAATIAAVVYVVLNGPDQPATIRRQPPDAKPRKSRRTQSRGQRRAQEPTVTAATVQQSGPAVALPGTPAFALADSDIMRLRVLPARRTTLWVRIRSGVALVVLVGVLGALLALAVGGMVLGIALLIRSATG
jgi:hypothetical protein